jgi:3D (Asp-Asp-Asp) domain-containing protein
MKKSTFLGSTLSVLLLFSVITYSRSLVQQQNPKSGQQVAQVAAQTAAETATTAESATAATPAGPTAPVTAASSTTLEKVTPSELYTATAYSLHGRTASGAAVTHGIVAADPRVLPIGSRVRIEAGPYSGEYLVADTGGAVRGKRIDIWTPTSREAMRFGRRTVKLTVLQLGGKRAKAASTRQRIINPAPPAAAPQTSGFYWPGKPQQ